MKLQDIMTFCAKTIAPEATIQEAAVTMKKTNVGFLPVIVGGEVVGVLTDRDIVVRGMGTNPAARCVKDVMTSKPITIASTDDVSLAIRLMSEHKIGRLPIVDRENRLVGVVSANDIARADHDTMVVGELARALGKAHQAKLKAAALTTL